MVVTRTATELHHKKIFTYSFNAGKNQEKKTLSLQVNIAEPLSYEELALRVSLHHNIPCFVEEDLKKSLREFIESERIKHSDEVAFLLIKKHQEKRENISRVAKCVAANYKKTWAGFSKTETVDELEKFSLMYHKLIHSQAMNLLLAWEENYYQDVQKLLSAQENSMTKLCERQELEMQRHCEHVSSGSLGYTEKDVNDLTSRHASDSERLQGEWKAKYGHLVTSQRKEYRNVVARLYGEMLANNGEVDDRGRTYIEVKKIVELSSTNDERQASLVYEPSNDSSPSRRFQSSDMKQMLGEKSETTSLNEEFTPHLEESFTINLGAQMKTMHNIRLVAAPILHFCRHSNQSGDVLAQRLQTVLSLYSNALSGIVLLVDNNISFISALKAEFSAVCEGSTEFHFPSYDEQLNEIKSRKPYASLDKASNKSEDYLSTDSSSDQRFCDNSDFQDGDFYVTKHSNLSRVHTVFHLTGNVTNLRSLESSATLTSRHPVILGLRHILKVMSSHDIATLMIPILLCHELTDRIDEAWIVKRAELIMKCVKGFMMEMAAWDGGISRTIQFVLPPGISENTFNRLSTMLPEIFRMTSARDLSGSTPKKVAPASPRPARR